MRSEDQLERYRRIRRETEMLCEPLCLEDYVVQPTPDTSPPKWHLGHTAWFIDRLVLAEAERVTGPGHPYHYIFNSYYDALGARVARSRRGVLSRPTVSEVLAYRHQVDAAVEAASLMPLEDFELALQHEQQHQELLLTDIKRILWENLERPVYGLDETTAANPEEWRETGAVWRAYDGGQTEIGSSDVVAFAFDNERPRHRVLLQPYSLSDKLVTNGEYLEFIESGGYAEPSYWLSDGWALVVSEAWIAPLYWERRGNEWWTFTLNGMQPLKLDAPACHVSYFEADAYARWRGARLPTEFEWEAAHHDRVGVHGLGLWQWTSSDYAPYPGFKPLGGALGEYNGKFMCGQRVLRGGSWATPREQSRPGYRNFFPPSTRWQFTGVRLAR